MDSPCKHDRYIPTTLLVKDPAALEILSTVLRTMTVVKDAEDYGKSKDTFYIELFHKSMLTYLDKHIHYQDKSYNLRQSLALLDWNEHIGRGHTSIYLIEDCRHPDRQGRKKKYVRKTYR